MRPIAHPPLRYASLAHAQPTLPFVPNGSIRYAYGLLKDRDIIPFRENIVFFNPIYLRQHPRQTRGPQGRVCWLEDSD